MRSGRGRLCWRVGLLTVSPGPCLSSGVQWGLLNQPEGNQIMNDVEGVLERLQGLADRVSAIARAGDGDAHLEAVTRLAWAVAIAVRDGVPPNQIMAYTGLSEAGIRRCEDLALADAGYTE